MRQLYPLSQQKTVRVFCWIGKLSWLTKKVWRLAELAQQNGQGCIAKSRVERREGEATTGEEILEQWHAQQPPPMASLFALAVRPCGPHQLRQNRLELFLEDPWHHLPQEKGLIYTLPEIRSPGIIWTTTVRYGDVSFVLLLQLVR